MKTWVIVIVTTMLLSSQLLPFQSASATFGVPINLSNSADDSSLSPIKGSQVATSGSSNVYVAWKEYVSSSYDIVVARSIDGGASFGTPINASNDSADSLDPQIVAVGSYVYVIWQESGDIYFSSSSDNGASFGTPVNVSMTASASLARIAAVGSSVYVVWTDSELGNAEVYFRGSNDNGASFDPIINISNDTDTSQSPTISIGNNVYVAWKTFSGSNTYVYFSRSTDGGASFDIPQPLGNSEGTSEGPELAATGDDVQVAWLDNGSGNIDTYYRHSIDGGVTFSLLTNISNALPVNSGDSSDLTMMVSGTYTFITWSDTSSGNGDAIMAFSSDGFNSSEQLHWATTSDASVFPKGALLGDSVYFFWQECDSSSVCDIYYMKGTYDSSGINFTGTVNLSNDLADSFHPQVAASLDAVYVAWTTASSLGAPSEIVLSRDPGSTFPGGSGAGPTANAGPDLDSVEGATVTLNGTNSIDPDLDPFTFSWIQTAGPSVSLSDPSAATPTFVAPEVNGTTTLTFELTVSNSGGSSRDTVDVHDNDMTGILNLSSSLDDSFTPSIAVNARNIYVAWFEGAFGSGEIMFSRSTDGGVTFGAPVNVSNNAGDSAVPTVVASGNNVYVVWEDNTAGNFEILLARSTDGGVTFGAPVNVSNDPDSSEIPHMAFSGDNLYVTWQSGAINNREVLVARSTDGGVTFGAPRDISNNSSDSVEPIAAVSDSNVYIAWYDFIPGGADILVATSMDGGLSYGTPVNISNNAGDSKTPWISATGSDVYVVWSDETSPSEILFSKSTDRGTTFSPPSTLYNQADSFSPFVASSGPNVFVVWENLTSPSEILFAYSTDTCSCFNLPSNVSNDSGDSHNPQVAVVAKTAYTTWTDHSSGNPEIFFKKFDINLTSAEEPVADTVTLADAVQAHKTYLAAAADTLSVTDSTVAIVSKFPADDMTIVDVMGRAVVASRSLSDMVSVTEAPSVANRRSSADTFAVRDSLATFSAFSRHNTYSISATDSISTAVSRSIADTVAVSDILESRNSRHASDALTTADAISKAAKKLAYDNIIATDTITTATTRAVADSLSAVDGISIRPDPPVLTTVTIVDAIRSSVSRLLADSIGTADGTNTSLDANRSPSDAFSVADGISIASARHIADSFAAADSAASVKIERTGTLTIRKVATDTGQPLVGAQFRITPDPFTLAGSLDVQDGDPHDADPASGVIKLEQVKFGTFLIEETHVPAGYTRIVQSMTASVHETQQSPVVTIENRLEAQPVVQPVEIPSPDLSGNQFDNFVLKGATVDAVPVTTVSDLPQAFIAPPTAHPTLPTIAFTAPAPRPSTTKQLYGNYTIPTYPTPDPTLAANNFYVVPPIIIDQQGSTNKFLLTPLLGRSLQSMTLRVDHDTPVASGLAEVNMIAMTFSSQGAAGNIGFSFDISDTVPPATPEPPATLSGTTPLYITVGFVGDFAGTTFSDPVAFQSSPTVEIHVSRSVDIGKLPDGCPDLNLLFFNEGTSQWETVAKPARDASIDSVSFCGYELKPGHWSKFAVGGVKITTNVLQSIIPHTSGGASKAASPSATLGSGTNVNTSVPLSGGSSISLNFASVTSGGNVKVSQPSMSQLANLFSKVSGNTATLSLVSGGQILPYSTMGILLDIDASEIKYSGPVEVSIPYDQSLIPTSTSESDIRFLHYTGAGWEDVTLRVDTDKNTVTGNLTSLSPVVPAVKISEGLDSYFKASPPNKVAILRENATVIQPLGTYVGAERQVVFSVALRNLQDANQDYTVVMQAVDRDGYTQSVAWQSGTLEKGGETTLSASTAISQGGYRVTFFVWDKVDASPLPLAATVQQDIDVP